MKLNLFSFLLSLRFQAQYQVISGRAQRSSCFSSVIADNGTKTITDVDGKLLKTKKHQSQYHTLIS
jgi:hypothetical protein